MKYLLRHKWFVFWEGLALGVPVLQLVIHDWHKFLLDEWIPYREYFYGDEPLLQVQQDIQNSGVAISADSVVKFIQSQRKEAFHLAWLKHQNRAPHHWQYWVRIDDAGVEVLMEMPDRFRREMLADWRGAGRAITGEDNTLDWYAERRETIKIHPDTRDWLDQQLGYEGDG